MQTDMELQSHTAFYTEKLTLGSEQIQGQVFAPGHKNTRSFSQVLFVGELNVRIETTS